MTAARRNIYIDDDINEQIEIMVADSGGRHGELRYVFNSLLRDSPKMKKLLKPVDAPIHTSTKAGIPATVKPKFVKPNIDDVACYMAELGVVACGSQGESFIDHWNEKEWKRGTKLMKDWKGAVRNWVKNGKRYEKDRERNQPDRNKSATDRVRDAMQLDAFGNADASPSVGDSNGDLRHVQQQAPGRADGGMGQVIEGTYTRTG